MPSETVLMYTVYLYMFKSENNISLSTNYTMSSRAKRKSRLSYVKRSGCFRITRKSRTPTKPDIQE